MRLLLLVFLLSFSSTVLFAQKGTVKGFVFDTETQEAIIGANVYVDGTSVGTVSDIDGDYEFTIEPGTYTIVVSYISFETKMVEGVVVAPNAVVDLNIVLTESSLTLSEVQVVDVRKTNTEAAILLEIRNSNQVVSGVSAQQISRTLDRDAGQVVRRIPGVLISGNFINIRGLNQRYNNVLLHNAVAPSMEADVKAFSLDIIPSSQIDRILILKSPSADVPAEYAGGLVKIFTRGIPDESFTQFGYTIGYRENTTFENFRHQEVGVGGALGFSQARFDLPSGFPADLRRISDPNQLVDAGNSLPNTWVATRESMALPDQRFSFVKGTRWKKGKTIFGNMTAVNFSNTRSTFQVDRYDYDTYNEMAGNSDVIYYFDDAQYNESTRWGVLHNWSMRKPGFLLEFKNLFNYSSATQYVQRLGNHFNFSFLPDIHSFDQVYRGLYSGQLLGRHDLSRNRGTIDWLAGYGFSFRNQPDYRRYRSDRDDETGGRTLYVPIGAAAAEFLGRFYSEMREDIFTSSVNHTYLIGSNTKKMITLTSGLYAEYRFRDFNARNIGYVPANFTQFDRDLLDGSIENLFNNISIPNGLIIDEQSNPSDSYSATNLQAAGFINAEVPIGARFRLIGGLRLEHNTQTISSATITNIPVEVVSPITRLLPSFNFTYNLTDRTLVRAAYGQTINRPEFRELAPFGFYDFNFNFTNKGNPDLKTPSIHNMDLRYEFYPNPGEVVSVAYFYKLFINPIEALFVPGAGSGGAKTFTFGNAERAVSQGVEIEFKKNLNDLFSNPVLSRLSLMFNAALIRSEVNLGSIAIGQSDQRPLQGQSPYLVNGGIFYTDADRGFQINAMYNVIGRRIMIIGYEGYADIYEMPRNVLDLSASYNLTPKMRLSVGVADILNNPFLLLQDGNQDGVFDADVDQVIQTFRPGRVVTVGFYYTL